MTSSLSASLFIRTFIILAVACAASFLFFVNAFEAQALTPPIAKNAVDLKVNGSDGPLQLSKNAEVSVNWVSSASSKSCSIFLQESNALSTNKIQIGGKLLLGIKDLSKDGSLKLYLGEYATLPTTLLLKCYGAESSSAANDSVLLNQRAVPPAGDPYTIKDVKSVTAKKVDPIPTAIDDEYTLYTIVLTNGKNFEVKQGFAPKEVFEKAVRATGYTGDIAALLKMATISDPKPIASSLSLSSAKMTVTASGMATYINKSPTNVCGAVVIGSIDWGDGKKDNFTGLRCSKDSQKFSLTHTYAKEGAYVVKLTDSKGDISKKISLPVNTVSDPKPVPSTQGSVRGASTTDVLEQVKKLMLLQLLELKAQLIDAQ